MKPLHVLIVASSQSIRDAAAKFFVTKTNVTIFFARSRKEAIETLDSVASIAIVIINNKLHANGMEATDFGMDNNFLVQKTDFSALELNAYYVLLSALLLGKKAYIVDGYSEEVVVKTLEISFDNLPQKKEVFIYVKDKQTLKNTLTMISQGIFDEACQALLTYVYFCPKKKSASFPKPFGLGEISDWSDVWTVVESEQFSLETA